VAVGGAGTGRFEALRTAAERRAARRQNPGLGRPAGLLLVTAAVVLVLGFVAFALVLPRATVTLQLKQQTVVAETTFLVLPPGVETPSGIDAIAGEPETVELEYTATAPTTGVARIGDQAARGSVRLANPGAEPVTIQAGTIGTGDTGLQFRFFGEVTVPAATDGIAGQTDAEVEMVEPGTVGNLGIGELSGRLDSGVYVSNRLAALAGGTDVEVRGVANGDLAGLRARFEQDLVGLAEARFGESLPEHLAVASGSFAFSEPEVTFDRAAGDPGETVAMHVALEVTGLAFDAAEATAAARPPLEAALQHQVPAGYVLDPDEIVVSRPVSTSDTSEEATSVVVTASGRAVYQLDEAERSALIDRLAGESAGEAGEILAALPAVESYSVDYFPGLVDRMPSRSSRIEIVVRE
jgi:hypothetical protein